ncbi:MAG: hypothetical protein HOI66_17185, partial [Verrucomicrobia bacterium]|nr:hypothetical protein [Verrucomicrobiota bacterium]
MNSNTKTTVPNDLGDQYLSLLLMALLAFTPFSGLAQTPLAVGIANVSPPPGATDVSTEAAVTVNFDHATRFQWTSNSLLKLRNLQSGTVVFEIAPEHGDAQEGQTTYVVPLPSATLLPETTYEVTLDYTFSRPNSPPWRTYPIAPGQWTFTTSAAAESAHLIDIPGVVSLYPGPDSVGHSIHSPLLIHFETPLAFNDTLGGSLEILEVDTGLVVNTLDPADGDPQTGADQFEVTLAPGTLQPNTHYEVRMAEGFARIQEAPWRNGEIAPGVWQFTTGGIEFDSFPAEIGGIRGVYPGPQQQLVRPDITPHIQFSTPVSFEWTEQRLFSIKELTTGQVIYEVDPEPTENGDLFDIIAFDLPSALLRPNGHYAIQLDENLARLQETPWRSGRLADDVWTFSTGRGTPYPMNGYPGLTHVYPAPGMENVSLEPEIALYFAHRSRFEDTEGNPIEIIKSSTDEVVYSEDPNQHDPQNGQFAYSLAIPNGILEPETDYSIHLSNRFASLEQSPWWSAPMTDDQWFFTTGQGEPGLLSEAVDGVTQIYPMPGAIVSRSPQTLTVYFAHRISFAETSDRFISIRNSATGDIVVSLDPDEMNFHDGLRHFSLPLPVEYLAENGRYEVTMDYGFARFSTAPWRTGNIAEGNWEILTGTGEFNDPVDPVDPVDP